MALQGSVSSSSLHQDETKQKALNLKLKLFRLGLFSHQRITKLYCLWSISMYYVFCFGLYIIVSVWADWRSESNDVFHLIGLCVSLVATVAAEDGDEASTSEFLTIAAGFACCCLFSFLAAIMGWQTDNHLKKGNLEHQDSILPRIYAIPYCFGFVSSIALALVSFFVMLALFCASILGQALNTPSNPVSGSSGPASGGSSCVERKVKGSKNSETNVQVIQFSLLFQGK
ncbi:hypothetical protein PTKIN_Ptkin12aG0197600 [Pterospermum kingtungense]